MAEQTKDSMETQPIKELHSGGTDDPALSRADPTGSASEGEMKVDEWSSMWERDETPDFHSDQRHPKLERFLGNLVNDRKELKFFFPLCGKAFDMKWMYDEGHTVVGVEFSNKAVEEFFLENDITYTAESVDAIEGFLYKSSDNRMRMYCCDFYKFTMDVEKDFTAIFDRGALVAVNKEDRVKYANRMMSLMAPDARYMLLTFDYDPTNYPGPPHTFSAEDIEELYGSKCKLDVINVEEESNPSLKEMLKSQTVKERIHIMSLK